MNACTERRIIMDNHSKPPVSIEIFAAYLDGNLSEDEMNQIDALVSSDPSMEELASISDLVDEGVQAYEQDEFALEADLTALEDSGFDIPDLDSNLFFPPDDDAWENVDAAASADDVKDDTPPYQDHFFELPDNDVPSNQDDVVVDDHLPMDNQTQDIFEENGGDSHESGDITIGDDFLDNQC